MSQVTLGGKPVEVAGDLPEVGSKAPPFTLVDKDLKDVTLSEAGDDNDAVDAAYRTKYGRHSGYVEPMVGPEARATTLRLVPGHRAAHS